MKTISLATNVQKIFTLCVVAVISLSMTVSVFAATSTRRVSLDPTLMTTVATVTMSRNGTCTISNGSTAYPAFFQVFVNGTIKMSTTIGANGQGNIYNLKTGDVVRVTANTESSRTETHYIQIEH